MTLLSLTQYYNYYSFSTLFAVRNIINITALLKTNMQTANQIMLCIVVINTHETQNAINSEMHNIQLENTKFNTNLLKIDTVNSFK